MYQGDFTNIQNHANIFANHLNSAINMVKNKDHTDMVRFNKAYVDARYHIDRIKSQWELMLNNLLEQYPTIESRDKPKEMFVYKV
jgi:bacterioferritin (cytochrome b1)